MRWGEQMEGKSLKTMVEVAVGVIAILVALSGVVYALHDDYVLHFVMPPMVKESPPTRPMAPLIAELDNHYARKPKMTGDVRSSEAQQSPPDGIQTELKALRESVEKLRRDVNEVSASAVPSAGAVDPSQRIDEVRLYLSTVQGEEHLVVLNGNSPRLAKAVRFGARYGVSLHGSTRLKDVDSLSADLRRLDAPGQEGHAAIGRIPKRHFERLGGRTLGYVVADLHADAGTGSRP